MASQPKPRARDIVKAHQFLYYVESKSVWSDYQYDAFCKAHKIDGKGGSDLRSDYSTKIVALAVSIEIDPDNVLYTHPDN
jgi:NAD-dependent DNA ligase